VDAGTGEVMDVGSTPTHEGQTNDTASRQMLQRFCDTGFDGSIEACALVLGRTSDEIDDMLRGEAVIDEDLVIKIRGVADERRIDVEA
jgi:hypothetical protein